MIASPSFFLSALLTGCLAIEFSRPVDIDVESLVSVSELGPDAQLQVAMHSVSQSAVGYKSFEPDCLVDAGFCELTIDVGGLGRTGVDVYVWLDRDGADEGDMHRALIDDDPVGYVFVHVPSMPYERPLEVPLDLPANVFEAE